MMTENEIFERIKLMIDEHWPLEAGLFTMNSDLSHLDSLEQVEFVMYLEEEFGIDIPDEEADRHAIWQVSEAVFRIWCEVNKHELEEVAKKAEQHRQAQEQETVPKRFIHKGE